MFRGPDFSQPGMAQACERTTYRRGKHVTVVACSVTRFDVWFGDVFGAYVFGDVLIHPTPDERILIVAKDDTTAQKLFGVGGLGGIFPALADDDGWRNVRRVAVRGTGTVRALEVAELVTNLIKA
jgi:hypothetical protein